MLATMPKESVNKMVRMDGLLVRSTNGQHFMDADPIEDSYEHAPCFDLKDGKLSPTAPGQRFVGQNAPQTLAEAEAQVPQMKRHDCLQGCGGRQTVQALGAHSDIYECQNCGKRYQLTKG